MTTPRANSQERFRVLGIAAILLIGPVTASVADTVTVAVATNFLAPLVELAARFESATGHRVIVVPGSTGKHYAQIVHGAPFDLYLAADQERPLKLEEEGLAAPGTRVTYAVGRLVLWSPTPEVVDTEGRVLDSGTFRHLAIANPRLAPYGRAARQTLERRGLWGRLSGRIVQGENVAQAFQLTATGNAELGFVAMSQLREPGRRIEGSYWLVPRELHEPIEQQATLVRDSEAARAFLRHLTTDASRGLIRSYGYETRSVQGDSITERPR